MEIGIFLAYGPKTNLRTEGLGRYLGNLIKGFSSNNNQITIACPKWLVGSIYDLFEDYMIEKEKVKFVVSHKRPILWEIYERIFLKEKKSKSKIKILFSIGEIIENIISLLLSLTNLVLFLIIAILGGVIGIILLPIVLFVLICSLIYKLMKSIKNKSRLNFKSVLNKFGNFFIKFSKTGISLYDFLLKGLTTKVEKELVKKINNNKNNINVWFSPSFFWQEFNNIKGVKIINAPDLVTSRFPDLFADDNYFVNSSKNIKKTISNGEYFITYCEYLRKNLVIDEFGKKPEQVKSIHHSTNNLLEYIEIDSNLNHKLNSSKDFTTAFSGSMLQTLPPCSSLVQDYISTYNFNDTKYVFYASQLRQHKNMLTLIKAYEYLLRTKYCNVKLFLTCNLNSNKEVKDYIIEHRLQFDIISFRNISSQQLAALYRCAEITVNPTLYEGGFPFTFCEGMSVGTPSIMSDIPQVREVFDGCGLDDYLFDPYNYIELANKLEYAVNHKEELYEKQLPLYNELSKRTPQYVADEYVEAFKYFIDLDQRQREG